MTSAKLETKLYVLVNNKPELCICCISVKNPEILSEEKIKKLRNINICSIGYYMDPIDPNIMDEDPPKTKEDQLLDFVHCNLFRQGAWTINHLKATIGYSSFTIFVNYGNLSYYPLAIATIDTITQKYRDEDDDLEYTKKYLYINAICAYKQYHDYANQLMDNIKTIAKLWHCNKIVFSSADNFNMVEWCKTHGFSETNMYDDESRTIGYNYHFHIE
jgi:hypothetical protein